MYCVTYSSDKFYIENASDKKPLNKTHLSYLEANGGLIIADLDEFGLCFIHDFYLDVIQELDITSYNLTLYKVKYKRLTIKNSSLFGIRNFDNNKMTVDTLTKFLWRHTNSTLFDDRILSASSISAMLIKRSGFGLQEKINQDMEIFIESAYCGGRCELYSAGRHDNVYWYDFPSMYGTILQEPLPYGFEWDDSVSFLNPGFYEIEFLGGKETHSYLPVKKTYKNIDERSVTYSGFGTGTYWYEEIINFVRNGGKVLSIKRALRVKNLEPFLRGLSESLIEERSKGCRFSKLVLNGVYGRLAMRHSLCRDSLREVSERSQWDDSIAYGIHKRYKGLALIKGDTIKQVRANSGGLGAAAAITSKARVRLGLLMREVTSGGGELIYVDTDSIFYKGPVIGAANFKLIGSVNFFGVRNYVIIG